MVIKSLPEKKSPILKTKTRIHKNLFIHIISRPRHRKGSTHSKSSPGTVILPILSIRKLGRDGGHAGDAAALVGHHAHRAVRLGGRRATAEHARAPAAVANVAGARRGPGVLLLLLVVLVLAVGVRAALLQLVGGGGRDEGVRGGGEAAAGGRSGADLGEEEALAGDAAAETLLVMDGIGVRRGLVLLVVDASVVVAVGFVHALVVVGLVDGRALGAP